MCIIIDADCFHKFGNPENQDMIPIRKWLVNQNGKIAYSSTIELEKEYKAIKEEKIQEWRNAGWLKKIGKDEVQKKTDELRRIQGKGKIQSNDPHIIALAMIAEVKLLVSHDKKLHEDFKEKTGGSIYQEKDHEHLLKPDLCPKKKPRTPA